MIRNRMKNLHRLLRYDWPLHFVLFFTNWLPDNVISLRLRGALASLFFKSCGANLRLGRNLTFYNASNITVGSDVYIAYGCWFVASGGITIADGVLFGPYCVVSSSNHTRENLSFRSGAPQLQPVVIDSGSWIAAHVTLTAGCKIGAGSLIAAGAVVSGNIPPNSKAGGVPARILASFDED